MPIFLPPSVDFSRGITCEKFQPNTVRACNVIYSQAAKNQNSWLEWILYVGFLNKMRHFSLLWKNGWKVKGVASISFASQQFSYHIRGTKVCICDGKALPHLATSMYSELRLIHPSHTVTNFIRQLWLVQNLNEALNSGYYRQTWINTASRLKQPLFIWPNK